MQKALSDRNSPYMKAATITDIADMEELLAQFRRYVPVIKTAEKAKMDKGGYAMDAEEERYRHKRYN